MKKLFFTALVAVAAVGGAIAQNSDSESLDQSNYYNCTSGADAFCTDIPENPVRLVPSGTQVNPASYYSAIAKYDF